MAVNFDGMAEYYDEMYVDEALYRAEAARVCAIAKRYGIAGGRLLDIACGTGAQALFLSEAFDVTGVDLSGGMLNVARQKVPNAAFVQGDMCDLPIGGPFDVAVNLYGSIGFVRDAAGLRSACKSAASCLRQGGLFILTPWGTRETFREGLAVTSGEKNGISYCRMEAVRRTGAHTAEVEMRHLIGRGTQITQQNSAQEITLFSEKEYAAALDEAGFTRKERLGEDEFRMGAFICTKK